MRRLCITLLCGLVAVPAALAAARATGDGTLEVFHGYGVATVTGTRGIAWGQMGNGQLIVTDYVAGDGQVLVSGADNTNPISANVTVYSGKDLHFRVTGGRYRLRFDGDDINLSAVGVGYARLSADPQADDAGDYALDGGKRTAMPLTQRLVTFPASSTTTTTTTTTTP
jgi:hypothetical protein